MDSASEAITVELGADEELVLRFKTGQTPAVLKDSVEQLLPLIYAQIRANESQNQLEVEDHLNRYRAVLALQMLSERKLQEAALLLGEIPKLVRGEVLAGNLGFPEFDDLPVFECVD